MYISLFIPRGGNPMNEIIKLRFSIIIPVYNRIDYVRKAVDSCLNQEYERKNIEIIVVKNFSDADLEEWLRQRSVLIINSQKVSLVDKLLEGISISRSDIVCLLEDDDEFVYNKLETLNRYYNEFPSAACVHNNFIYKEEKNYEINKFYLKHQKNPEKAIRLKQERQKLSLIKQRDIYHNLSSWSFRRDSGFTLLQDMAGLTYDIDFLLYIEVIEHEKEMIILPEKLTIYRRHDSATRIAVNDQNIINFFESSIFSLQAIGNKVNNNKLRNFINSNIDLEKFKINIIEKKSIQISDIKNSLRILLYPPYVNKELYPFLFLYLVLGAFKKFRKDLYVNHAYTFS